MPAGKSYSNLEEGEEEREEDSEEESEGEEEEMDVDDPSSPEVSDEELPDIDTQLGSSSQPSAGRQLASIRQPACSRQPDSIRQPANIRLPSSYVIARYGEEWYVDQVVDLRGSNCHHV